MDLLDRLLEHDRWATTQLLDLSRGLSDAQLDQEFDIGHRTLRATYAHMIFIVGAWTALMTGQPHDVQHDRSVAAFRNYHERSYPAFASTAREAYARQRLEETFIDAHDAPMTFGGAILQVILHNTEHRAEVLHILERLGVPDLPEVDHGLWDFVRRGF